MESSTSDIIMASPPTTPPKKTVQWEPLASKRIYYIHDSPSKSEEWEKRRVFLHDEIKPVSRLGDEPPQDKGKGKEKKQVRILLPPPHPKQWKGKEKELDSDSEDSYDEDFDTRNAQKDNSPDYIARELAYITKETAHLFSDSSSSYSICGADSDSDDDDDEAEEIDALGNAVEMETLDSMDWSNRAYHKYLRPKVADEDVRPVCVQYFLRSVRRQPETLIDAMPGHYNLAESAFEAMQEVDRRVDEYKEKINYPNVDFRTKKFVERLEGYAEEINHVVFGYTKVKSVSARLKGCVQKRDLKFLVAQIGVIVEEIDGNSQKFWAVARRELDVIPEEDEEED